MKKAQVYNVLVLLLCGFHCILFCCFHLQPFYFFCQILDEIFDSKKYFFKIIVWITNVVKYVSKCGGTVFSPNYPRNIKFSCLQHATEWNQFNFAACSRQQKSQSKMLQNNYLTMGDTEAFSCFCCSSTSKFPDVRSLSIKLVFKNCTTRPIYFFSLIFSTIVAAISL